MKLEFDSIQELDAFLSWADNYSAGANVTLRVPSADVRKMFALDVETPDVASLADPQGDVAFDTPQQPLQADHVSLNDKVPETSPEPARRKRRTKAEIEADDKAAAEAAAAKAQETPADASTAPEGANPFAAVETAAETPTTPAAEPDAADTTVTPFQHLTRAREFIAKHGMPKYNESFAKAGLDANVMGYSAYQRALHMDALAALEAA